MPIYDRRCADGHLMLDLYEKIETETPPCKECGKPAERVLLPGRTNSVIPDEIPGGIEIRHGICNEDGTPKRYYSYSAMREAAKKKGLVNLVEHIPERGSDKSKHTTRWV